MNDRIEEAAQSDLDTLRAYRDLRAQRPNDALLANAREWQAMAHDTAQLIVDATNADTSSMVMRAKIRDLARQLQRQLERCERSLVEMGKR